MEKSNLNTFRNSLEFASNIYHNGKTSLEDVKNSQNRMFSLLNDSKEYDDPKNLDKIKSREETSINAQRLHNNRTNVIKTFEDRVFPFNDKFQKKDSDMSDKPLPIWVKVDKKIFDKIKNHVQNTKNNNLQARTSGKVINLTESN